MIVRYTLCPIRMPIPSLGTSLAIPRPILAVQVIGLSRAMTHDGQLDSGADESLLDAAVAQKIGAPFTGDPEREVYLVGRGIVRCRHAVVRLRITDGRRETYEWSTVIAVSPFPLPRSLWGYAGFLQFFNADFRGADWEVHLLPNKSFPGQQVISSPSPAGPP
jgi:hypothetical protein